MQLKPLTCLFVSPLQGEGRGFESPTWLALLA
jgi:hypothetical protein